MKAHGRYEKSGDQIAREKQQRDVNNICRFARFVIYIDARGMLINIVSNTGEIVNIIAIVCVQYEVGVLVATEVLLEVGYGRTRPYANIEKDGKLLIPKRRVKEMFALHEYEHLCHVIFDCIEEVVIEVCVTWENSADWFVDGIGYIPRGVTFTVSRSDEFLYREMLIKDIRRDRSRNIEKHVRALRSWIGHYKRIDYSEKQLRSFGGSLKTADLLRTYEERSRYRDAFLRTLSRSSNMFAIVERIIRVFSIDFSEVDPEAELICKPFALNLRSQKSLWVRLRKQPSVHAKGCLVAEIGVVDQSKISKMKEVMNGNIQSGTSP